MVNSAKIFKTKRTSHIMTTQLEEILTTNSIQSPHIIKQLTTRTKIEDKVELEDISLTFINKK